MNFSRHNQSLCLDNISVGIICFDSMKKCIYTNQYVIDLFGEDNVNNTNMITIYRASIHNEDRINEIKICNDFFNNLNDNQSSIRLYNQKLREYRWMTNKRSIVKNLNNYNESYLYIYTLCDIQENKLLELKLKDNNLKAEESYNHKSIFLANISHEIRTPLNGIIGMLTLLNDTELNNEQQDYISMIKECSYNLMSIISDILDYSKLEVGKIKLDIKSMNLYKCIEATNDIVLSKIYEKSLVYNYNINYDIPEYICGDENRIKQILLNLLSNSIKFMEQGNIFVNIKKISNEDFDLCYYKHKNLVKNEENENIDKLKKTDLIYIRFDVKDSGCGIDILDKDKIFESFSQINNSLTTKIYPGTGLGLSICKELVELMGGVIWLEDSELGKGSMFSFVLPFKVCEIDVDLKELNIEVLKNANVLIVDDNVHNRISLSGIMNKWGMNPHVYSNGEEALYFSRIINFDIGLIDICMPKMDGITFAMKFRNQEEFNNNNIPLIALSSLGDKIEINSQYFQQNLIKPIKESKLKSICIDVLQKRIMIKKNKIENNTDNKIETELLDKYIINNNLLDLKNNVRILIAEDIYINRKVITSFLNKLGFNNLQIVDDGKQCLNLALTNDFDIILLDIIMPIMNGEVVLKELIKHYSKNEGVKPYIIAVTAYCLREDKQNYLNLGFDDYIVKPININELNNCLSKYIEKLLEN
jgi:signal transduction histidine kinase/DNA-binding response OmpR family regulator